MNDTTTQTDRQEITSELATDRQIGTFFGNLPLRTKLIVTFVGIALVSLSLLGLANNRTVRVALQAQINQVLLGAASETAEKFDGFISSNLNAVRTEAQVPAFVNYLSLPPDQRADSVEESEAAATLRAFSLKDQLFVISYALLDRNGQIALDTNAAAIGTAADESQQDYFHIPLEEGRPYVSTITFSESGGSFLHFSSPVRSIDGQIIGVLRVRYNASILQQLMAENNGLVGEGSVGILLDENYLRLADGREPKLIYRTITPLSTARIAALQSEQRLPVAPPAELSLNLAAFEAALKNMEETPFFSARLHSDETLESAAAKQLTTQPWVVVFSQVESTFLAPIDSQTRTTITVITILAVLVTITAVYLGQRLASPIVKLTSVAQQVAQGDLTIQAPVDSLDESGQLATAFNFMTTQIRELINTLEERVADRTRDLKLSAEVARQVTTQLNLDELLPELVEQMRETFDLYYASVFLFDEASQHLVLAAGTRTAGQQMLREGMSFAIETQPSAVAKAAREKQTIVMNDVSTETIHIPNPNLPDTQSEIVLPMLVGNQLIGVLGLQSEIKDRFSPADVEIFSTLAEQIAIAVNNAQLYRRQAQLAEELRHADQTKTQFLASMSHELRTPLNGIMNFTEMVSLGMMGPINEEQKELLDQSLHSSKHLLDLINDVLDITKIQAGRLNLFIEENVNLYDEINSAINIVKPLIRVGHVTLVEDIDDDLPLIAGDKRRVRQILLNLASNAAKFTDEGTITISAKNQGDHVLFAVIDTGKGISKDMRAIIFEPFIQTVDGIKHAQGTGLGLPITKSLVEAHGGRLWVESEVGAGSAFYASIPVKRQQVTIIAG